MRLAYPSDKLLDFLEVLLKRFGQDIPNDAKKLVINSFERPRNLSEETRKRAAQINSPNSGTRAPIAKIRLDGNDELSVLVHCTKTFDQSRLIYAEEILEDQVQMLIASFWIFEGLEGMPELSNPAVVRDWKELILQELVTKIQEGEEEGRDRLETVAPLIDNLLKLDRSCNPEDADEKRYSRRQQIVEFMYEDALVRLINLGYYIVEGDNVILKALLAYLIQLDKKLVAARMLKAAFESKKPDKKEWVLTLRLARELMNEAEFTIKDAINVIISRHCRET